MMKAVSNAPVRANPTRLKQIIITTSHEWKVFLPIHANRAYLPIALLSTYNFLPICNF